LPCFEKRANKILIFPPLEIHFHAAGRSLSNSSLSYILPRGEREREKEASSRENIHNVLLVRGPQYIHFCVYVQTSVYKHLFDVTVYKYAIITKNRVFHLFSSSDCQSHGEANVLLRAAAASSVYLTSALSCLLSPCAACSSSSQSISTISSNITFQRRHCVLLPCPSRSQPAL
jgi:hypothetical protein